VQVVFGFSFIAAVFKAQAIEHAFVLAIQLFLCLSVVFATAFYDVL
jgi:hypothetical protein